MATQQYISHARRATGGTKSGSYLHLRRDSRRERNGAHLGVIPFERTAIMVIAILFSLLFIVSISLAFVGADEEESLFKPILDNVAANSPGIVLIGEDVDVDVDEPSVGIRWSILACGEGFFLEGSENIHGAQNCGLPAMPLQVFVDNSEDPTAVYDPTSLSFIGETGQRHIIQNAYQFDSDHVLDVHDARRYPFDTYFLSSTIRAVLSETDENIPIQKLATIDMTSSFFIVTTDQTSYTNTSDGFETASRNIDFRIRRPTEARIYTLGLFHINWMFTHVAVGQIALAWKSTQAPLLKRLLTIFAILLIIPQLRNTMPNAPGFNGILLDSIGFFPQMVLCGLSGVVLLLMMIKREPDFVHSEVPPSKDEPIVVPNKMPPAPCQDIGRPMSQVWASPYPRPLVLSTICNLREELARLKQGDGKSYSV